jgi:chaperonin GroEL (HSP60 family)
VTYELLAHDLSVTKWNKLLTDFVLRAVEHVKPSSRMLNDLMDINEWIKVKIVDWVDMSRSQYINGVVFTKNLADKRMLQEIKNP